MHCTWFTSVHKCPRSWHSSSEHKWADRWLSQRNRRVPGELDPPVRCSIFPEHSSKSWAPARAPVVTWFCWRFLKAHHGDECQAEHYKFCVYSQKRLCYLCVQGTPSTCRESQVFSRHIPARWVHQAGSATQACLLFRALSWGQDTHIQEQSPQEHPCSWMHRRGTRLPPACSPLSKAQDVTAP